MNEDFLDTLVYYGHDFLLKEYGSMIRKASVKYLYTKYQTYYIWFAPEEFFGKYV